VPDCLREGRRGDGCFNASLYHVRDLHAAAVQTVKIPAKLNTDSGRIPDGALEVGDDSFPAL
jgi:hypothetical protein